MRETWEKTIEREQRNALINDVVESVVKVIVGGTLIVGFFFLLFMALLQIL